MAQDGADESAGGRGFLRDMAAQSARAHTFDRRMRWFWLRRSLRDTTPAADDVVDLRGHLPPHGVGPPATPAAPLAPVVPDVPDVPGGATGQVPRQRS